MELGKVSYLISARMNIQWEETGSRGICFIDGPNCRLAVLHYLWSKNNLMVIDQLELFDPGNSSGLIRELTENVVENARIMESRIIPLCDQIMEEFEANPAYRDVLYMKEKARGGLPFAGHPFKTRDLFS